MIVSICEIWPLNGKCIQRQWYDYFRCSKCNTYLKNRYIIKRYGLITVPLCFLCGASTLIRLLKLVPMYYVCYGPCLAISRIRFQSTKITRPLQIPRSLANTTGVRAAKLVMVFAVGPPLIIPKENNGCSYVFKNVIFTSKERHSLP